MHAINWFEIPTQQLGRAVDFYRAVMGADLKVTSYGGGEMASFPGVKGDVHGALVRDDRFTPGSATVVYLNASAFAGGLDGGLARVTEAGGAVVLPKTSIGEHGYIALFKDSEGNTVGLHAF